MTFECGYGESGCIAIASLHLRIKTKTNNGISGVCVSRTSQLSYNTGEKSSTKVHLFHENVPPGGRNGIEKWFRIPENDPRKTANRQNRKIWSRKWANLLTSRLRSSPECHFGVCPTYTTDSGGEVSGSIMLIPNLYCASVSENRGVSLRAVSRARKFIACVGRPGGCPPSSG